MSSSCHTPTEYSHLPPVDHRRLIMSTWHILEQPPPPTIREILGAYRSKGDGDRDMLIAMLNAKSAEDQRIAAIASLHRTLLDLYTTDAKVLPHAGPLQQYPPLSSPHISPKEKHHMTELSNGHESVHKRAPSPREPPYQSQPSRKRQRYSRSPPLSSHYDACSARPSSRELPPSPYSSRSDSEEYSPRSRASMAIGSLLSSAAGRDSVLEDSQIAPDVSQTRYPPSTIGVSV